MLCLEATASAKMRKELVKMLNMSAVKTITLSQDKLNVKYVINKAKSEFEETFGWLISELKNKPSSEKKLNLLPIL